MISKPFFYCYLAFLLSLAVLLPAKTQSSTIDSLRQIVSETPDELTRIENTNFLALALLDSKPEEALTLLQAVYPAAAALEHPLLADISHSIGRVYQITSQLDSALIAFKGALVQAQQLNNWPLAIRALSNQADVYNQSNTLDTGLLFAQKAYQLALEKKVEREPRYIAANMLGRTYSFLAEYDSASVYLQRAIAVMEEMGEDQRLIAEMHINVGNNEFRAQNPGQATFQYQEALRLMQSIKDTQGVAIAYRTMGAADYFQGKFPEAIANFHLSVDALEGTDYYNDLVTNLDYLGEAYLTIEDYPNALLYWQKAIDTWQLAHGEESNAELVFKKGRVYFLQENYSEALDLLVAAKEMREADGTYLDGDWYWYLGKTQEMLGNLSAATTYYELAMEHPPFQNIEYTTAESLIGLATVEEKNNRPVEAQRYYQRAYELASEHSLKESEMYAAAGLYRLHKKNGNSATALQYLEINRTIQDSLYNEENTRAITRMQANFEFEQEKQELVYAQEEERKEQSNLRRFLWAALAFTGLLLLISLFYFRSMRKANQKLSRLNEKIRHQKDQLEELDRAKSRFFTNISHEFRTPLTIIKGMNERIREQSDARLDNATAMIRRNTHSLLNLINQILDLRKLESNELKLQLSQGDIVEYLRFLVESHQSLAEHHEVLLHFQAEISSLAMDFDPDKLLRVVSNLLSNAIKFTPTGGHIYVRIQQVQIRGEAKLNLEIKDTGIGIAEENLAYIFDRFYQEDNAPTRSGEGTGIGLALSQELVKLMGGQIQATSQLGKGSIFTIILPITRNAPTRDNLPAENELIPLPIEQDTLEEVLLTEPTTSEAERPRLLIVEDNKDVQAYLAAALQTDYDIDLADNGAIGIEKAITHIPDLIISDVMMPEKDGYELTDTLKRDERTDHIPIILLTAKSDTDSKISGLEKGADAYLAKPFEEKELLVRIDKLLELRKKLQERYASLATTVDQPPVIQNAFLQKLHDYVEEHLADVTMNMDRMSKDIGLSRTQIFRKLKALTGKSPSAFIRAIRLQKGKQLLETTDLTVSEIAYDIGYSSPGYFSTLFLEEYKRRPSEVRKQT